MDELPRRVAQLKTLKPRELEILRLTCAGLANRDIAERLSISGRAVLFHKGNIYQKLGLAELQQAHRLRELDAFCHALSGEDL
jgi:DNA-binding CsgD family transcriptional regulator